MSSVTYELRARSTQNFLTRVELHHRFVTPKLKHYDKAMSEVRDTVQRILQHVGWYAADPFE